MSIMSMCQWLQDTNIGTSIRESIWVFPIIETMHVLALSISVGLLLVSDLRLMGVHHETPPGCRKCTSKSSPGCSLDSRS